MADFPHWPYIVRNAIQGTTPGYAIYKVVCVKFIPEDFENGNCKYITYGGLYFKDRRHNIKYNWFYSGSFYWLNTKKLFKHILSS